MIGSRFLPTLALLFISVAALVTGQGMRPDWHTGDYPGRDALMWKIISEDLKTSFPRGGWPIRVKPFWQDHAEITPLEKEIPADEKRSIAEPENGNAVRGIFEPFLQRIYMIRDQRLGSCKENEGWENWQPVLEFGRNGLPDDEVRYLTTGPDGRLYVATASGIGILGQDGKWSHLTGKNGGLPVNDVTCLSFHADGTLWVGTKIGAARRNPDGSWNYRMGPRWMMGDEVIDILALDNGGAKILTRKSLTTLTPRLMTLREKAKYYDEITQARHVRHGAVTGCAFRDPSNLDSWYMDDDDNDGLWTSIYTAAKCFEWAATRDPEALELAKRHFDFLERLETINGIPGYVSRSIRPSTFAPNTHEQYNYKGGGEWHESTVEPGWQWKSDTSSDELSGHFFVWSVYYDLVAKGDAAEEKRVQDLVRRVMNFIIDHDYCFVDVDGHPTRWAIYTPRLLHGDLLWSDQIGFNALGIMAHMKSAIHICGDQKFKDAYQYLMDKYGYHVKLMEAKNMIPNTPGAGVNHSDDEMAWLEYYHLLSYPDEDPHLTFLYKYSAARSMRTEVAEKSPFFNFPFAIHFPEWGHVADAVDTLKDWPLDLRQWSVANSKRDDVIMDPRGDGRHGERNLLIPVDMDERVPSKWNHDPYEADGGNHGITEAEGGPWLLPYWMAVYHGLIVEDGLSSPAANP